jgi:hypothetical protein
MNQHKEHPIDTVPKGYLKDAQGRLVPENLVKPIDMARDSLTRELANDAILLNQSIAMFKAKVFGEVGAFVQLSAEQYETKVGGKKGNITLHSYDGRYRVQVATSDNIVFDERLQAAKTLIDACISDWSEGSSPEIKVLVQDAFQADKEGKLNTGRILGLRRLDIKDERWQRAMTAISESVTVVGSKQYVRFYERVGESDQYAAINLDIAAV